jgi:hypothetical protein
MRISPWGQNNDLGPKTLTTRVKDIQQAITNLLALPIDKMLYMCIYVCIQIHYEKITINKKNGCTHFVVIVVRNNMHLQSWKKSFKLMDQTIWYLNKIIKFLLWQWFYKSFKFLFNCYIKRCLHEIYIS